MKTASSTMSHWLHKTTKRLNDCGIDTARLDCLVLLEDKLKKDRSWLLAHPDAIIDELSLETLSKQIARRAGHEPLAYIRGKSEFYGREFIVNAHTLEPRPETETMIELALNLAKSNKQKESRVIDVGTGSGAIAITMKLELPELEVIGTDIDSKCIKTAKENASKLGADVTFYKGSLLEPTISTTPAATTYVEPEAVFSSSSGVKRTDSTLHEQHRRKTDSGPQAISSVSGSARNHADGGTWMLLANLPYVPNKYQLNKAAKFEPKHAIFGGEDGLDLYRELFVQLKSQQFQGQRPKHILTESLPFQHEVLASIAKDAGYKLSETEDFIQVFTTV